MALIELERKIEARRLQNDGYPRTGKKSVEANFNELQELFQRDDITVNKVVIHRENGDTEAEIIDQFIQEYDGGKYKAVKRLKTGGAKPSDSEGYQKVSKIEHKVFRLKEDKMKIYSQFENILFNQAFERVEATEEEFKEKKQEYIDKYEEKIEGLKNNLEKLKDRTFKDLEKEVKTS
jgi:hypothetical protein